MIHEPESPFGLIVSRLSGAIQTTRGVRTRCPAHDDREPSLDVDLGKDGRVLLKCRSAGCSTKAIVEALGLRVSDLFRGGTGDGGPTAPQRRSNRKTKRHATLQDAVRAAHWSATNGKQDGKVTTHEYTDATGDRIGAVVRVDFADDRKKELRRISRDGDAWVCRDMPKPRPLYRRHRLDTGMRGQQIVVVEGEKCADTLEQLGFTGTTSAGGAHAPMSHTDWSPLARQHVVVVPDNDPPGQRYGNGVTHQARRANAASVKVLLLAGLGDGEDIDDWVQERRNAGVADPDIATELRQLMASAAEFHATTSETAPSSKDGSGSIPLGNTDPKTGRIVLSPRQTLPTALAYIREFATHAGHRTLFSYADTFWAWRGNHYAQLEESHLSQELQRWLHKALRYVPTRQTGQPELVAFESNPSTFSAALAALRAETFLAASTMMPAWLGPDEPQVPIDELLPCKTGTLHVPTGRVLPPTPLLFNVGALSIDYDPSAPEPRRWHEFVRQLFGDDKESIDLLQEWFAYCLTADTRQQKMLLLLGPRRSGKGTIARVLTQLVGGASVVGPTVSSIAGNFGLQPLLGKSLAIVSDARFTGDHVATVVERLLCISGEDAISVDRKFKDSVTLRLPVRFMFLTNELPKFNDSSMALAGRFLVLRLTQSFYGKEDTSLSDALNAELPGILRWAIDGWHRLRNRGHFLEPQSSRAAIQDIEDLSSPVGAFVREQCVVGPGHRVTCTDLFDAWTAWCRADERSGQSTKQSLGRDLTAAFPSVSRRRGTNTAFYEGIGLRKGGKHG